jgi:hypothetical protein
MKTLLFIVAAGILSLNAIDDLPNKYAGNYCAEMKDGILMIMHDGSAVTSDVTLANGTMIKMNGTVIMSDGKKLLLSDGDCVDPDGNLINSESDDKGIKEPR